MFTDENKIQFEKWLRTSKRFHSFLIVLKTNGIGVGGMPFEMQIGVYLAYYDSLGIDCDVSKTPIGKQYYCMIEDSSEEVELVNSRNEAYKQAFIKANSIVNESSVVEEKIDYKCGCTFGMCKNLTNCAKPLAS